MESIFAKNLINSALVWPALSFILNAVHPLKKVPPPIIAVVFMKLSLEMLMLIHSA